jgi:alpha-galactosidase
MMNQLYLTTTSPQHHHTKLQHTTAFLVAATALLTVTTATITDPEISPTPPMGFNNWARFMDHLNETLFVETANAMEAKGLLAAGYNRLNLDDAWMNKNRTADQKLHWNEKLFPHGIPWLADYVKSKGFSLGIYSDSGNETCGHFPGSENYEKVDADTYAEWGIDYLKLDGCNMFDKQRTGPADEAIYKEVYGKWHSVLADMSEPLIFSQSAPAYFSGGMDFPIKPGKKSDWYRVMEWAPLYGELARHSADIFVYDNVPYGDQWRPEQYWESIMANYDMNVQLARYQQPGFYNDPDFLTMDYPWLTLDQKKSHFALWASFSAPLIISSYIPDLSKDVVDYLTNREIIAVDQDPLGLQATLVSRDGTWDVLTKSLANGDRLMTVLNRGNTTASTSISVARLGLPSDETYAAKDLWTGGTVSLSESINITLAKHATAIYRISGVSSVIPTGMIFNTASTEKQKRGWDSEMAKYLEDSTTCLTASSNNSLTFDKCASKDSQVWQVASNDAISPLSSLSTCVTSSFNSTTLEACDSESEHQRWSYQSSGNLINAATGRCFTTGRNRATTETCGDYLESQVFSLPTGVRLYEKVGRSGKQ